jgi:glucose dehydrogenase
MSEVKDYNADIVADVVIIGAGLIGGLMAWDLSRRGINVAMLDSGSPVDRIEAVKRFKASPIKNGNSAYEVKPFAPIPDEEDPFNYYVQENKDSKDPFEQVPFHGLYLRQPGGTSWHFTGHAERMYPNDFRMKSAYGRGLNWPISYEDLVPYYGEVERQWGVAGNETCVAPTKHAYPLPYVPLSYLDQQVDAVAQQMGDGIGPLPSCRASVPYPFQGRAQCCGNASCRFICPTGAKYDGSVHVQMAQQEGALLYSDHVVDHIEVDDDKQIKFIRYKNYQDPANPVVGVAHGKLFILAAHGIEAPRLLLMSAGKNAPKGVSNSSDQVGRNLMTLMGVNSKAYVDAPVYPYRGPVNATGAFKKLRDGDFRKDFACIGTIVINGGFDPTNGPLNEADDAIADKVFGEALRKRVYDKVVTQVYLDNSVEVLPDPKNRVTLAKDQLDATGLPRPKIDFRIDKYTYEGMYVSWKRNVEILQKMGGTLPGGLPTPDRAGFEKAIKDQGGLKTGEAMIAGTTRMGDDPKTSVVDAWCRSHDHKNLFIVGTGNYVTGGSVSPSLTAAALGLRTCEHIAKDFIRTEG